MLLKQDIDWMGLFMAPLGLFPIYRTKTVFLDEQLDDNLEQFVEFDKKVYGIGFVDLTFSLEPPFYLLDSLYGSEGPWSER